MRSNTAGLVMALLLLAGATRAMAETPADRGRVFYAKEWDTPEGKQSCASCHTKDPRANGLTRANKVIKPLAPSANPARFTDKAKTEKWFRRNCGDVLGRECTPQEKGDLIAYLQTVK